MTATLNVPASSVRGLFDRAKTGNDVLAVLDAIVTVDDSNADVVRVLETGMALDTAAE